MGKKLNRMYKKGKSQAAMEFLMSYGWAILVVLVAIAALSYFGVLISDRLVQKKCFIESGIACADFTIQEDSVTLVLRNGRGEDITVSDITVGNCSGTGSGFLKNGEQALFVVTGCTNVVSEKFKGEVNLTYTGESGLEHIDAGKVQGKVTAGVADAEGGDEGGDDEEEDSGLPQGPQRYFFMSNPNSPQLSEATIDPLDVHVGDTQTMTVIARDTTDTIISVTAAIETDNGIRNQELVFIEAMSASRTKWEGNWVVEDTHSATYRTTFTAENDIGETSSITLTWTDPCAPGAGGDWTLDDNCSITGVHGVDAGDITVETYTLTINDGATFAWNPSKSIIITSGSIAINVGGQLKQTYLWMVDADTDGYPSSTTMVAQDTAPANGRRRNLLSTYSSADVNDGNGDVWQTLDCYTDADGDGYDATGSTAPTESGADCPAGKSQTTSGTDCLDSDADVYQNVGSLGDDDDQDGYYEGSLGTQCVGASSSVSGRTMYNDAAGAATWLASGSALGSGDCDDTGATKWQNRYTDADSDTYCPNSDQTCVGDDAGYVDSCTTYTDCNDGDDTEWRNRYSDATDCKPSTLACVGDHAGYQDTQGPTEFTVFVTSTTYQGNFGSPATADGYCDTQAAAGGLSGSYTAWVAEGTADEPRDRGLSACVTAGSSSMPWHLPSFTDPVGGPKVADEWADLTDNSLDDNIDRDELGLTVSSTTWTQLYASGAAYTGYDDCSGWSTTSGTGIYGGTASTNSWWSAFVTNGPCTASHNFYCFQHSPTPARVPACYTDSDGDTYGAGTDQNCTTWPQAGYSNRNDDCYDGNADANPIATAYYTTDRGDGSFDYNCDSSETKNSDFTCNTDWATYYSCYEPPLNKNTGYRSTIPNCGDSGTFTECILYSGGGCWPQQSRLTTCGNCVGSAVSNRQSSVSKTMPCR